MWRFSILQLTAVEQTSTLGVLQSTLHGCKLLSQLLSLETDKILMIAFLFHVILVAVTMEIAMISKISLQLVSQKALLVLPVHMELPDRLVQMINMGSALLLPLPGAREQICLDH